jgi:hypothetical protein
MKVGFSRQILETKLNIRIYQNLSNGSRVFPCGQTDRETDGQTYMTKLIVTFKNVANAPKKYVLSTVHCVFCRSVYFRKKRLLHDTTLVYRFL